MGPKYLRHLLLVISSCYAVSFINGQTPLSGPSEIACVDKGYKFRWLGQYHLSISDFSKQGFYACENSLPDTIGIVNSKNLLIPHNVTWTNVTPISGGLLWTNTAKVSLSNFSGNSINVTATFQDSSNETITLKIKISKETELSYGVEKNKTDFDFDSNRVQQYPTYLTDTYSALPYKFLLNGVGDTIKAITKPPKAFYSPYFTAENFDLIFNPTRFQTQQDKLSLFFDASLPVDTIQFFASGCKTDPELVVFVGDSINKTVDFIILKDQYGPLPKYVNPDKVILEANQILNTVGLNLKIDTVFTDTLYYDKDHDHKMSKQEQNFVDQTYKGSSYTSKCHGNYKVWIVNELGYDKDNNAIGGRATTIIPISNSLTFDAVDNHGGRTLAHELGHACFGFMHPFTYEVDPNVSIHIGINPVCCYGVEYNINCCANDSQNYMWWDYLTGGTSIRAYQFKQIHRIR